MQKLRLTLFWTVKTRTGFRRIAVQMAENQNKQRAHEAALVALSVSCHFLTWLTLQDTRHDGNTMKTMKKMLNAWKHAGN